MVTALLRQDEGWFRLRLSSLLAELRTSNEAESWWRRALQHWRELRRRSERVMNPTGLTIGVRGGTQEQREEFTRALEENLRPAFRRTVIRDEAAGDGVRSAVTIWLAKVRSTLVIRRSKTAKSGWAKRDEIRFVLPQEGRPRGRNSRCAGVPCVAATKTNAEEVDVFVGDAGWRVMSRILLSAYACEPGKGSEPEVGWLWATELADSGHEVWVITREANRQAIEIEICEATKNPAAFRVLRPAGMGAAMEARRAWRSFVLRVVAVGRVSPGSAADQRDPLRLRASRNVRRVARAQLHGAAGLPFFLGPVSGGETVPNGLRAGMTRAAQRRETARDLANRTIHADPIMRSSFRQAKRIFVATPESLQLIPPTFQEKCTVQLGIGLSRDYLAWSSQKRKPAETELRLLYAGRLLEWKGVDLAIHAIRRLQDRGVAARFTIVGDGPARAALLRLATELGIAERVRWLAWLPRDQMSAQYYEYDALLFPSLRDSGGMVVLEALAHGLPVVCTDCGGPGRIVNGCCGRVVQTSGRSRNELISGIAEALHELSCDRTLLMKLSRAARRRAWEFDFHKVVARVHPIELGVNGTGALREFQDAI